MMPVLKSLAPSLMFGKIRSFIFYASLKEETGKICRDRLSCEDGVGSLLISNSIFCLIKVANIKTHYVG